jgi:hypothetical protein
MNAEGIPCNAGYKPLYSYPFIAEKAKVAGSAAPSPREPATRRRCGYLSTCCWLSVRTCMTSWRLSGNLPPKNN